MFNIRRSLAFQCGNVENGKEIGRIIEALSEKQIQDISMVNG